MLSFSFLAGNVYGPPRIKSVDVSVSGPDSVYYNNSYSFDMAGKTRNNMGFVTKTFTFTAGAGNTSTIRFASKDPASTSCGAVLDNIVVAPGENYVAFCRLVDRFTSRVNGRFRSSCSDSCSECFLISSAFYNHFVVT